MFFVFFYLHITLIDSSVFNVDFIKNQVFFFLFLKKKKNLPEIALTCVLTIKNVHPGKMLE